MPNETNTFRPATVAQGLQSDVVPDPITESQYAQDRFLDAATHRSNPLFALTNTTINRLVDTPGGVLRGYIRRTDITAGDETSRYRLYFMYNPAGIQREYISYLNQQALDPGNAVFGSNNMSAAPALLDFQFELLFDRQIEVAQDPDHPGTKVDYDYFDLVVRGIVPDQNTGNAIPDNGIMMVNPHSVVVVFGEDLSVQGRVYNASINFEKFNNRMVPTRLRITIQMKAFYIGPVATVPDYSLFVSQSTAGATIPYENSAPVQLDFENPKFAKVPLQKGSISSAFVSSNLVPSFSIPVIGSADENEFAKDFLISLAVPVSQENTLFVLAWERAEGGIEHNNPLNTTQQMPGSTLLPGNPDGVQVYVSIQQGLEATVITITNGLYENIMAALRDGTSSCAAANALAASPWGTGTLVKQILGCP